MLINLSNHPSTVWDEKQVMAAHGYGEIVDMPFPAVSPMADSREVRNLASDYVSRIMDMADEHCVVHVMGEMTFTYHVVVGLKENGITCLASTTDRDTFYDKQGRKVSDFTFVRFREF